MRTRPNTVAINHSYRGRCSTHVHIALFHYCNGQLSVCPVTLGTVHVGCSSPCSLRQFRHWVRGVSIPDRRHKSPYHALTPRNAAPTAFLELLGPWKKHRRGRAAASARQVCRKGEKQRKKNYLFPFFTPASILLFLLSLFPSQQFVFLHDKEIIRASVVCDKQRPAPTFTSSNCISTDLPNFRRSQHNKNISKNRGAPTNERKVKAVVRFATFGCQKIQDYAALVSEQIRRPQTEFQHS